MDHRYLNRKEAAAFTGFAASTLAKWAATDKGPRFRKFGEGRSARVRYLLDDLRLFMESAGKDGGRSAGTVTAPNSPADINVMKPDADEIHFALTLLSEPGQIVELRLLKVHPKGQRVPLTMSGYFDDHAALAKAAATYGPLSQGVYITLNPITHPCWRAP